MQDRMVAYKCKKIWCSRDRTSVRLPPKCKLMSNVIFSTTTLSWITKKELEHEIRKQKRQILLEEKHANFIGAVRK